jgi:hypothetical protein
LTLAANSDQIRISVMTLTQKLSASTGMSHGTAIRNVAAAIASPIWIERGLISQNP